MANVTLRELGVSLLVVLVLGLTMAGCSRAPSTLASSGSGLTAESASPVAGLAQTGDGLTKLWSHRRGVGVHPSG